MQRWTSVAYGLIFAAAVAIVVWQARAPGHAASSLPGPAGSGSAAPSPSAGSTAAEVEEPDAGNGPAVGTADGGDASAFAFLADGRPAPPLPATAPKSVDFGVILFSYRGAEAAAKSAPTRQEALEKARIVLEDAKKDFADACKKGDRGSTADAGRIPQGVLEPAVEYVLFTLTKDTVYKEPIDTPRGWWIVRRND